MGTKIFSLSSLFLFKKNNIFSPKDDASRDLHIKTELLVWCSELYFHNALLQGNIETFFH